MELTQEQNLYLPKNNKAVIGLLLSLIGLLSSLFIPLAIISKPFIMQTTAYRILFLFIFIFAGIIVIIGTLFAIIGFKSHKIISIIAIILCLLSINPLLVIFVLMSSVFGWHAL